jgi:cation diffusion facilitator CzcD-associated flavoprotein CzcO
VTVNSTETNHDTVISESDVIIVGTGFSGLGIATALKRSDRTSFVILERADDVGGTWRDNTYPGAACDIQSHLYSYSFRPNPDWSRVYAAQPEILAYLRATAAEEGLLPHIHFRSDVSNAAWDASHNVWRVRTEHGTHVARALVTATGHLSDPKMPAIEGLEDFSGELFHSAKWNHDVSWEGRRVGVLGTGASAIQVVPELAKTAAQVAVFQRSAPYIVPRRDHIYSEAEKGMFRKLPATAQAVRDGLFWGNEARFPQRQQVPRFVDDIRAKALQHLNQQVEDPELLEQLTPTYEIGCKRILISNDYYPALAQPNVEVLTGGVERIEGSTVVTADKRIDLDVLVCCTGFEAVDLPIAQRVTGRDGVLLADRWSRGGQAFACTTVAGFPNLFVMLGPNTGVGAGSIVYMVETQISYIEQALRYLEETDSVISVTEELEEQYVSSIDARAVGTVWTSGGCKSWYVDQRSGRLSTLWPDFMSQFRAENGTFNPDVYDCVPRSAAVGHASK